MYVCQKKKVESVKKICHHSDWREVNQNFHVTLISLAPALELQEAKMQCLKPCTVRVNPVYKYTVCERKEKNLVNQSVSFSSLFVGEDTTSQNIWLTQVEAGREGWQMTATLTEDSSSSSCQWAAISPACDSQVLQDPLQAFWEARG